MHQEFSDARVSWAQVYHQKLLDVVDAVTQSVTNSNSPIAPEDNPQKTNSRYKPHETQKQVETEKAPSTSTRPVGSMPDDSSPTENILVLITKRVQELENTVALLKETIDQKGKCIDDILEECRRLQREQEVTFAKISVRNDEIAENQTFPLPAPPQKAVIDVIDLSDDESQVSEATPQAKRSTNSPNNPNSRMEPLPSTIAINSRTCNFTREELAGCLGGGTRSLIVKIAPGNKPSLATSRGIDGYLCPNVDNNPWCPTVPGQHGYIFVGLGQEHSTFLTEEERHVFVGKRIAGQSKLSMTYIGLYRCFRVDALTVEEWKNLSSGFRKGYSEITLSKTRSDLKGIDQDERKQAVCAVEEDYENGVIRVPCVRLICIGYDMELAEGLPSASVAPSPSATAKSSRSKRMRRPGPPKSTVSSSNSESDEDEYEPRSHAKRQRR